MNKPIVLFKVCADETRLRILNLLARQDCCVCELQFVLRQTQSKISRHLALLRRSGLIANHRHGKWVVYSLAKPKNGLRTTFVRFVEACFCDIDYFKRDLKRLKNMKPMRCG